MKQNESQSYSNFPYIPNSEMKMSPNCASTIYINKGNKMEKISPEYKENKDKYFEEKKVESYNVDIKELSNSLNENNQLMNNTKYIESQFAEFQKEKQKIKSSSEIVNTILQKLGKFIFRLEKLYDGKPRELKPKVITDDKSEYFGFWDINQHQKDGFGIQIWNNGSLYEGCWSNNMPNGNGRQIFIDGGFYDGDWVEGRRENFGTFTSANGSCLKGSWSGDLPHGECEEIYPDGERYKGMYNKGKKQGHGYLEFPDGSSYEGEFFEGMMHGKGKFKWKDGRSFNGEFAHNCIEGNGLFKWPDGRKYEGKYFNNLKNGNGTFIWPCKASFTGTFKDGLPEGDGTYKMPNQNEIKGLWSKGELIKNTNEDNINE